MSMFALIVNWKFKCGNLNLIHLYKVAISVLINVGLSVYSTSKTRLKSAPKPYHAVRERLQDQFYFIFALGLSGLRHTNIQSLIY